MSNLPQWLTPSGNIITQLEGDTVSFQLDFFNPHISGLTITLIAGQLPSGITLSPSGLISGTLPLEPIQRTYEFTIRIANGVGISDRSFNILIQDTTPSWSDPSNLGIVPFGSFFEYQYFVFDPGAQTQSFQKIRGQLPPGMYLDKNGVLSGIPEPVNVDTQFEFDVRCWLDGEKFEDRSFSIVISVTGNRPPVWLTPSGLIGFIDNVNPFEFEFHAGDADFDTLTFTGMGLPPGLTLSNDGVLSGTLINGNPQEYAFVITVSDGQTPVSRQFRLIANQTQEFPITWITPSGNLGTMCEGERSLLGVQATSESRTLFYEIVSGSLPPGLFLNPNNGEIWGIAQEQGSQTTYTFDIEVTNNTISDTRQFAITIQDCLQPGSQRVELILTGNLRDQFYELVTSLPPNQPSDWFRQGSPGFGLLKTPRILVCENVAADDFDQLYNILTGFNQSELIFGKVEFAKVIKNGQTVYEVLYRRVYDSLDGALTPDFDDPSSNLTIRPGSLRNLRQTILDNIQPSGPSHLLPAWMTSEQIAGQPDTALGWTPALVFAHVQPGRGEQLSSVLNNLMNQSNRTLYQARIPVDRFLISPTADSTFAPTFLFFGG